MRKILPAMLIMMVMMNGVAFGEGAGMNMVKSGDITFYSVRDFAIQEGYKIAWNESKRAVELTKNSEVIQLNVGSSTAVKDGSILTLPGDVKLIDGKTFITVKGIRAVFEKELIRANDGSVSVLEAKATVPESKSYTVEALIARAKAEDYTIKQYTEDINKSTVIRDDLEDTVKVLTPGLKTTINDSGLAATWKATESTRISLDVSKKNLVAAEESIEYKVKNAVEGLALAKEALALTEKSCHIATVDGEQAKTKYKLGMISQVEFEKAQADEKSALGTLAQKRNDLTQAYTLLNKLAGLALNEQYMVTYPLEFSMAKLEAPEGKYADSLLNSSSMYALNQQIALAKLSVDYYVYGAGEAPFKTKEIAKSQAQLNLDSAKNELRKAIYDLKTTIESTEQQQIVLNAELEKSKKDVAVAEGSLNVGLITQQQLDKAVLAQMSKDIALKANTVKHMQLVRAYLKPWVSTQ